MNMFFLSFFLIVKIGQVGQGLYCNVSDISILANFSSHFVEMDANVCYIDGYNKT